MTINEFLRQQETTGFQDSFDRSNYPEWIHRLANWRTKKRILDVTGELYPMTVGRNDYR